MGSGSGAYTAVPVVSGGNGLSRIHGIYSRIFQNKFMDILEITHSTKHFDLALGGGDHPDRLLRGQYDNSTS